MENPHKLSNKRILFIKYFNDAIHNLTSTRFRYKRYRLNQTSFFYGGNIQKKTVHSKLHSSEM